jgi:hypothetical protein
MHRRIALAVLVLVLLLVLGLGLGLTRDAQRSAQADSILGNNSLLSEDGEIEDGEQKDEDEDEPSEADEEANDKEADEEQEVDDPEDRRDEKHHSHMERRERNLHLERSESATHLVRLELATRFAQVATDEATTAAFAMMHFDDLFVEQEDGIEFLNEILEQTGNDTVRRIIRVKLAELYREADQRAQARRQLKKLLTNK